MTYAPDTTLCLINFKDGIYDITGQSTVRNSGATLSSDQYKYNSKSAYFNYAENDSVLITLPREAKTVSLGFYATGNNTSEWYPTIWSSQASAASGGTYTHVDDGSYSTRPVHRVNSTSSSHNNGTYGPATISRNTGHHYAYCNQGNGTHKFFLDGVLQATVTQSNPNELTILSLGGLLNSSNNYISGCYYSGYIGEVLITSDCLYSDNFSVPTEAGEYENAGPPPLTIDAESNYGTYYGSIANVTDGNQNTYWGTDRAQSQSQFILFTFSKPVLFNGLTAITTVNTGDCISSGTILQTSEDGSTWNNVGYFTGRPECTFSDLNISNVSYVRLGVETASNKWLCVNEITLDYIDVSNKVYIKSSGSWHLATAVYKKINGTWVEQNNLHGVFDSNVNYIVNQI